MLDLVEVHRVSQGMMKYGGSFVKCLGQALQQADYINQHKIKDTWPGYWSQYNKLGE